MGSIRARCFSSCVFALELARAAIRRTRARSRSIAARVTSDALSHERARRTTRSPPRARDGAAREHRGGRFSVRGKEGRRRDKLPASVWRRGAATDRGGARRGNARGSGVNGARASSSEDERDVRHGGLRVPPPSARRRLLRDGVWGGGSAPRIVARAPARVRRHVPRRGGRGGRPVHQRHGDSPRQHRLRRAAALDQRAAARRRGGGRARRAGTFPGLHPHGVVWICTARSRPLPPPRATCGRRSSPTLREREAAKRAWVLDHRRRRGT